LKPKKIAIVTTVSQSLDVLFPDFYPKLIERGYEVAGVCSFDGFEKNVEAQGVRVVQVPMLRSINLVSDIYCLIKMYKLLRRERFDLVHYSTPKASLIASVASWLDRVPARLYTCRGLVYTEKKGLKRFVLKLCETISVRLATKVIAISPSLRDVLVADRVAKHGKVEVIGAGSSKGVNLERFELTDEIKAKAIEIRGLAGCVTDDILIGYCGRITPEKGIRELYQAVSILRVKYPNVRLLIVGNQDDRVPLSNKDFDKLKGSEWVSLVGFQHEIVPYLAVLDIFVMPSYREGFGNVNIEAAAMSKPIITTDVIGCKDTVIDGKTGLLVKVKDVETLTSAIESLVTDDAKRHGMGKAGRRWVEDNFNRNYIWSELFKIYDSMV
jgi:glycosyltransferase involved in cell wall biosynthesis